MLGIYFKAFHEDHLKVIVADETFVSGDTDFQAALTQKSKIKNLMQSYYQVTTLKQVRYE